MWKRFVTNGFRFTSNDAEYRRVYIINVSILLISLTLLFFSIYNAIVIDYQVLAAVELAAFILLMGLLCYFHKTSNIKVTAYGVLLLAFLVLAALMVIVENREYALYWLIVFSPIAIFLLGYKMGVVVNMLFLAYFLAFMLQGYGEWKPAVFDVTSIINVVFAFLFLVSFIAYFDLSREEAGRALQRQSRKLEEEHAMLDRYAIVCTFDLDGNISYVSRAFTELSGYSNKELIGRKHLIDHCGMDKATFNEMWSTVGNKEVWSGELRNRNKEGGMYWMHATVEPVFDDSDGKPIGYRLIGEDVTDKKRVEELAISDYLTRLYNRVKLDEELSKEILRSVRYKTPFCVILLDIDHFKSVNDSHGHQMGDTVLKEIAQILKENTRKVDTAGRWGGEEFLVITPFAGIDEGVQTAEKLRTEIESREFERIGTQTASFGIAEYREGDTMESLTERVDKALYRAKSKGRNRVES
ncbi:sensor domain-containing diguanylate cyclase [Sulfurimonas sp. HSL3-7]|uniref:sensor domain-containing diguanylate cyclase n=1 Tax=Sulfonitrofixus jiaomeiensis TaxID=3131938 RepID=UPI0031F743B9